MVKAIWELASFVDVQKKEKSNLPPKNTNIQTHFFG